MYLQLLKTLYRPSWAAVHNTFFLSASSLPLYIFFRWSRSVTRQQTNRSGDTLSHVGSFDTKNFFSEGQKNLVNLENKENLSNYQLLKRKPSVCSSSLHFSKINHCRSIFFPVTPVLQWFQLNFGARIFRGRRSGTSVLRMLLRLTAVRTLGHATRKFKVNFTSIRREWSIHRSPAWAGVFFSSSKPSLKITERWSWIITVNGGRCWFVCRPW